MRGLFFSILLIFILITSVGLVLKYYFPEEQVRAIAEGELTKKTSITRQDPEKGFNPKTKANPNAIDNSLKYFIVSPATF